MEMILQDYLRSDWTPDAEFVDGTIEERHHGDEPHSSWMNAIMFWFQLNGEA